MAQEGYRAPMLTLVSIPDGVEAAEKVYVAES
jgi:hypothetical protein